MYEEDRQELRARIKVIGVGGAGGNAVDTMISSKLDHVEFIAGNTDSQALRKSLAPTRIQLGAAVTRGLGAGADPEVGLKAAEDSADQIREALEGADMVFVTAGMGGGTGTGAAPLVARLAQEAGALTVGVVTKPFDFEGRPRSRNAESGLIELRKTVDTLIVIPNQRIFSVIKHDVPAREAFRIVDDVLQRAVKGISDLITKPGRINLDFADVKRIMLSKGRALMGTGVAKGDDRAEEAARTAISSPLLEDNNIDGAMGVLVNVTGGPGMGMGEMQRAVKVIQDAVHQEADIIVGLVDDEDLEEEMMVTVIATGFGRAEAEKEPAYSGPVTRAVSEKEVQEIPAFKRQPVKVAAAGGDKGGGRASFALVSDDDEFEIPAFLRRQAD